MARPEAVSKVPLGTATKKELRMRRAPLFPLVFALLTAFLPAQTPPVAPAVESRPASRPVFRDVVRNPHLPVLSQDKTNTCWSYATVSMLEAEILRLTGKSVDLSEMWFVRMTALEKADRWVRLHGFARFDEGGLSHDVTEVLRIHGALPATAMTGLGDGCTTHDHAPLWAELRRVLAPIASPSGKPTNDWRRGALAVIDRGLGVNTTGPTVDPKAFAAGLGISATDYVEVMSDETMPFDDARELFVPDNWIRWQQYRNRPVDTFVDILKRALRSGMTVAIDCDVSEPGFRPKEGIADLDGPTDQLARDAAFEFRDTTDDHLMHAVGLAEDANGGTWFIVKNSWGDVGPYKGYLYMSERYARMKMLAYMVHRSALDGDAGKR